MDNNRSNSVERAGFLDKVKNKVIIPKPIQRPFPKSKNKSDWPNWLSTFNNKNESIRSEHDEKKSSLNHNGKNKFIFYPYKYKDKTTDSLAVVKKKRVNLNLQNAFIFNRPPVKKQLMLEDLYTCLLNKRTEPGMYDMSNFCIVRMLKNNRHTIPKNYDLVYRDLIKLFTENTMNDNLEKYSEPVFKLYAFIIDKKFKIKISRDQSLNGTTALKELLLQGESDKRAEECKKKVFSVTFKYLKNKFSEETGQSIQNRSFELLFYKHYFQYIVKKEKISIRNFYYPISYNKQNKSSFKTINKQYISCLKKSRAFVKDFHSYMKKQIFIDHVADVESRLIEIIYKWNQNYLRNTKQDNSNDNIYNCFNKEKSKMPWTNNDLKSAIEVVKNIFKKK